MSGETALQTEDGTSFVAGVQQAALVYFGRKSEYDGLVEQNQRKIRLKKIWNGKKVEEWTGWYGTDVGKVMKLVREWTGGDEVMMNEKIGEERLMELVLLAKNDVERRKALGEEI